MKTTEHRHSDDRLNLKRLAVVYCLAVCCLYSVFCVIDNSARLRYSVQADFSGYLQGKENKTMRERERELRRRRKRRSEVLKGRTKTAKAEAAAKKAK